MCLAGVEPRCEKFTRNEILFFTQLLTIDPELQFYVEFVGGDKGGRRLVLLRDEAGDNNITELLLEAGAGVRPRGRLTLEDEGGQVSVSHMKTPSHLFLLPKRNVKTLESIMIKISQSLSDKSATAVTADMTVGNSGSPARPPAVGSLCLAYVEEESCWSRAEVISIEDQRLSLFLIDRGATIQNHINKVKPMRGDLQCIPGLVVEAQLRGVRPGTGTTWIKEELEYCEALLDADTPFLVRNLQSQDQKTFIDLEDPEGMDVAFMMVELGCAAPDKLSGIDTLL